MRRLPAAKVMRNCFNLNCCQVISCLDVLKNLSLNPKENGGLVKKL
jgi:hypothetical protein